MQDRALYRPSGRVNLADLWPHALLMGCVGLLTSVVYGYALEYNAYAIGWIWFAPVGLQSWLLYRAIRESHCRNVTVAVLLAGFIGLATVVLMYHLDQCRRWDVGWDRLDRLPGYVAFRMDTDGLRGNGKWVALVPMPPAPAVDPDFAFRPKFTIHWTAFVAELIVTIVLPMLMAWRFARRPYSELRRSWFTVEKMLLTPESAIALRAALRDRLVSDWARDDVVKEQADCPHAKLELWYCPNTNRDSDVESDIYLCFEDGVALRLDEEEVAAMAWVFPSIQEYRAGPIETESNPQRESSSSVDAEFHVVAGIHAGACKRSRIKGETSLIRMLLQWWPLLLLFGFILGGLPIAHFCDCFPQYKIVIKSYAIGGAAFVFSLIAYSRYAMSESGTNYVIRFYADLLKKQIASRDDAIVPANHPEALYVRHYPRRFWQSYSDGSPEAEDALFLIDLESKLFLYEGDLNRWIIPFASVVTCELEDTHWLSAVVLLTFITPGGIKELPLYIDDLNLDRDHIRRSQSFFAKLESALHPPGTDVVLN